MQEPVILVTGAGKGIGRAIVEELGRKCDEAFRPKIFISSRTAADLKSLKDHCHKLGMDCEFIAADLSSAKACKKVFSTCMNVYGRVDMLVNNAGVGRFGPFLDLIEEDLDFVMDTNVRATFLLTQMVYAQMQKQKIGDLIFVTSVAAEKAFEQSALYCMSKFAQKGLVEVLRLYGRKDNIRVMNVMPGPVHTPMWGEVDKKTVTKMVPVEHCARAIVHAMLLPRPTQIEELVIRPVTGDLP